MPIDVAAALFAGGDRSAVLTWLRAGMPFAIEGDWESGEGFVLICHWMIDWGRWATTWAEESGDHVSARELRLDCFGDSGGWTPNIVAQFAEAVAADGGSASASVRPVPKRSDRCLEHRLQTASTC